VLSLAVCTAARYRNDMSVFDHHSDGVIQRHAATKHTPPQPSSAAPSKNFSASQVTNDAS